MEKTVEQRGAQRRGANAEKGGADGPSCLPLSFYPYVVTSLFPVEA